MTIALQEEKLILQERLDEVENAYKVWTLVEEE